MLIYRQSYHDYPYVIIDINYLNYKQYLMSAEHEIEQMLHFSMEIEFLIIS